MITPCERKKKKLWLKALFKRRENRKRVVSWHTHFLNRITPLIPLLLGPLKLPKKQMRSFALLALCLVGNIDGSSASQPGRPHRRLAHVQVQAADELEEIDFDIFSAPSDNEKTARRSLFSNSPRIAAAPPLSDGVDPRADVDVVGAAVSETPGKGPSTPWGRALGRLVAGFGASLHAVIPTVVPAAFLAMALVVAGRAQLRVAVAHGEKFKLKTTNSQYIGELEGQLLELEEKLEAVEAAAAAREGAAKTKMIKLASAKMKELGEANKKLKAELKGARQRQGGGNSSASGGVSAAVKAVHAEAAKAHADLEEDLVFAEKERKAVLERLAEAEKARTAAEARAVAAEEELSLLLDNEADRTAVAQEMRAEMKNELIAAAEARVAAAEKAGRLRTEALVAAHAEELRRLQGVMKKALAQSMISSAQQKKTVRE